jgi:mannose-6-phosphate isomerase-like protein (cupin superfamily)
MTALTSMGQATSGDPIPLKPDLHKPVTDNLVNDFLFFSQRFFNSYPYDLVKLGIEHSRIVHGGHAIPLFYQKSDGIGVRSAWYQINKGERVNEPGDTNPFPQYFIVIKGSGYAKIGSDTIQLQANHAYYIPPDNDHVFWNDNKDPVELIFLAWGKGA